MSARVAGLVLAAGASTRMGRPKALLPLHGRPLIAHVLDAAAAAGLAQVVVVLGADAMSVKAATGRRPGVRTVVNERFASGQASSLGAGLAAMGAEVEAALVLLADQPEVRPHAIATLAAAWRPDGPPALRASYRGRPAHPVVLGRPLWGELAARTGDAGARGLLGRPGALAEVEVGGDPPEDVDTPAAYAALRRRAGEPIAG